MCASKFKSMNAFCLFARNGNTLIVFNMKSSHRKGPSDGLGGVMKSLASTAVCAENWF